MHERHQSQPPGDDLEEARRILAEAPWPPWETVRCPVCERDVMVRRDGSPSFHTRPHAGICTGIGQPPNA